MHSVRWSRGPAWFIERSNELNRFCRKYYPEQLIIIENKKSSHSKKDVHIED